jgi:hypothetical protein
MDSIRSPRTLRITPVMEWLLAAGFLSAVVAIAGAVVDDLRAAPLQPPAAPRARALATSIPPAVPARAVSVPMLPFQDGREVKVGDSVSAVAAALGRAAEVGRQEVDRVAFGERLTRFYEYGGARFILVFEPLERNAEARLTAIYLP